MQSEGYNSCDYSLLQDTNQTSTKTSHSPIPNAVAAAHLPSTTSNNPLKMSLESMGGSDFEMKVDDFQELQKMPGNDVCADCGVNKQPDWGSPALGILFCFQCSGIHRGLGTHISFVRSVRMDQWSADQIALMRLGGNDRCNAFLQSHGIVTAVEPNKSDESASSNATKQQSQQPLIDTIRRKYDNPVAQLYKQVLKAERDGLPIPTELPAQVSKAAAVMNMKSKMVGFGSSPPPPPTADASSHHRAMAYAIPAAIAVTGGIVALAVWMLH